jgi:hypothetical protein
MKRNLLYVSLFLATALVSCKSKEVAEQPVEEVTTEEVTTEEVIIEEPVVDAPVEETKTTAKKTTKKEVEEPILESKEAPSISKTKGGLSDAFKEDAKETPKIERKKGLGDMLNEGK